MVNELKWTILGVPIDCSGQAIGVERMPEALRAAGLVEHLAAHDVGDLPITIGDPRRDPVTGLIGFNAVCSTSIAIRDAVGDLMKHGDRPLVVGGDCTLLIGVFAALKNHFERVGLAFVDGHLDFYDGQSSPTGEASDMELAILIGIGPPGLIDLAGSPPLIAPADIAVIGYRDGEQADKDGAPNPAIIAPSIHLYDAPTVRSRGPSRLGSEVSSRFVADPGRFWLHLDLDVLDETVMPAVDYRMQGGLEWDEVTALIHPFTNSPALIGMDVTILNPNLDPNGEYARRTVKLLGDVLRI